MRPFIATSVVLIVFGLALGLLNLYIVGRIDAAMLLGLVGVIAVVSALATASVMRK